MISPSRKEALSAGHKRYFTGIACLRGHVADRRAKTGECLTCRADFLIVWRKNNPNKVKQHNDTQYTNNTQKIKDSARRWGKNNPVKILVATRKQQAKRLMRCPKWLTPDDFWLMGQAYQLAALRTKMLGFAWHVDHIIPLQGRLVSGLHVPHNLQVIPGVINVSKANKYVSV